MRDSCLLRGKVFLAFFIVFALVLSVEARRRRERVEDKLVYISGDKDKQIGFITVTHGITAVASNYTLLADSKTIVIRDAAGKVLKYEEVMVPADGRNIVFFKLGKSYIDQPFLISEARITDAFLRDKVTLYGFKEASGRIFDSSARIIKLEPTRILLHDRIYPGMNGGPVISRRDGKVLGIIHLPADLKEPPITAVRIDTVGKLVKLDMARFHKQKKLIHEISARHEKMRSTMKNWQTQLGGVERDVRRKRNPEPGKINRMLAGCKQLRKDLDGQLDKWENDGKQMTGYLKNKYDSEMKKVKQVRNELPGIEHQLVLTGRKVRNVMTEQDSAKKLETSPDNEINKSAASLADLDKEIYAYKAMLKEFYQRRGDFHRQMKRGTASIDSFNKLMKKAQKATYDLRFKIKSYRAGQSSVSVDVRSYEKKIRYLERLLRDFEKLNTRLESSKKAYYKRHPSAKE